MKRIASPLVLVISLFATSIQASDELLAAATKEQEAFKQGDCDQVESMLGEDLTFYANSRKMTRAQVASFCRSIKRPFGDGRSPIEDTITPYLLNENLGYTVRDFRWRDEGNRIIHEVVTKIWAKRGDGWKMIHFQSTVMPEKTGGRKP